MKRSPAYLVMKDENKIVLLSLPLDVSQPGITTGQQTVFSCEKIASNFSGTRGWGEDSNGWCCDSGCRISRQSQSLGGRDKRSGSMVWTLPAEAGTCDFRLFDGDIDRNLLAQRNAVTVS